MELTQEQQQALQNLTKVFSPTASKKEFDYFFIDDLSDLQSLKKRQDEINNELKEMMGYSDVGAGSIIEIIEEFSQNERDIRRIKNKIQTAENLLVVLGVKLV